MNPHTPAQKLHRRLLALGLTAALPFTAVAADLTWTGGAGSPFNWSDAANWGGTGVTSGDNLLFTGTTGTTNRNDLLAADYSLGSLTFRGANNWVLGVSTDKATNKLTLSGGISLEGTGSVNIASDITLVGDQVISNTSTNNRTLLLGADDSGAGAVLDFGSNNLTFHSVYTEGGSGVGMINLSYGGNLIGSGTITKTGSGAIMLRGNGSGTGYGSFTGDFLINEGLVRAMHVGALGTVAGTTTVASGASLSLQGASGNVAEFITVGGSGIYYANDRVYRGALSLLSNITLTRLLTLSSTTDVGFRYGDSLATINAGIAESAPGAGLNKVGSWFNPSAGFLKVVGSSITYTGATTVKGGGLVMNGTHGSALNRVAGYSITHETLSQATSGVTGGITSQSALAGTGTVFLQAGEQIALGGANAAKRAIFAPGDVTAVSGPSYDTTGNGLTSAVGLAAFTSTVGTFTVNAGDAASGVTFGDFSQFSVQIGAAGASDKLVIANGGTLTITGDTLLSITGTLDTDYIYTIAEFGGRSGAFLQVDGLSEGWSVVYNANSIELAYGVIPEPSTAGLLAALATLGFVATRRRRATR